MSSLKGLDAKKVSTLKSLARRRRVNGERVNAARKLARQRRIDHAVTFEPALSAKDFRYDIHSEMRFTAWPVAGMTFVLMRFILDIEARRRESLAQLFRDEILGMHEWWLSQHMRMRSIANHVHFCRLSSLEAAMPAPA